MSDKSWRDYLRPIRVSSGPYQPARWMRVAVKPVGNPDGVWLHEQHAAHADYLLELHGIKDALKAYVKGIGEACR
jgi:hypothetical protein